MFYRVLFKVMNKVFYYIGCFLRGKINWKIFWVFWLFLAVGIFLFFTGNVVKFWFKKKMVYRCSGFIGGEDTVYILDGMGRDGKNAVIMYEGSFEGEKEILRRARKHGIVVEVKPLIKREGNAKVLYCSRWDIEGKKWYACPVVEKDIEAVKKNGKREVIRKFVGVIFPVLETGDKGGWYGGVWYTDVRDEVIRDVIRESCFEKRLRYFEVGEGTVVCIVPNISSRIERYCRLINQ